MSNYCLRYALSLFLVIILFGLFPIRANLIQAVSCGNGKCQGGETCQTCPEDCGACPTSTPSPTSAVTPTSVPESTPIPTLTSTSTPGISSSPTPTSVPGSTSTPTPSSSSSSNSSSNPVIYPSITLSSQGLLFWGTASISQGAINTVEYSLDDGKTWSQAVSKDGKFDEISEDYAFSPQSAFTVGVYKIIVRAKSSANAYTQSANYASVTITVTAPKVTLDKILPNPTKDQTPTIIGKVSSDFAEISKVQLSLDDGKTWFPTKLIGKNFSVTTKLLEDGNYSVKARVFDVAGNIGQSKTQILIIDTIPPIIGGNVTALGPQVLTPDVFGTIRTVENAHSIIISMRGGATKAILDVQNEIFNLTPIQGTNLWIGKIVFNKEGEKPAKITAVDGAGNTTERTLNPFLIEKSGRVVNIRNGVPLKNAQVSLYFFEAISESWVLWDGLSFGQKNPQKTNESGIYNYIVPSGRYYLEVQASGFQTMRSEIIELTKTTTLVATFPLSPKPRIAFRLPILGELNFVIPLPYFAKTLNKNELWKHEQTKPSLDFGVKKGIKLPDFSLPDSDGKTVNSSDYKSKSLVLTFLSIWAPPSIEQALILNQTRQSLNKKQSMLAIFLQDSPGEVETFMKRGNYNFNAAIDKDGVTSAKYQISTLPQHVFIDSTGAIYDTFTGVLNRKDLLEKLNQLD